MNDERSGTNDEAAGSPADGIADRAKTAPAPECLGGGQLGHDRKAGVGMVGGERPHHAMLAPSGARRGPRRQPRGCVPTGSGSGRAGSRSRSSRRR